MKFLLAACVLGLLSLCAQAQEISDLMKSDEPPANMTVLEQWQNFEKRIKMATNAAIKMLLPHVLETSGTMKISQQCMKEGMQLISGLRTIKPWAMKFIDSSAKIMDGILEGSMSSFGAYDECINNVATSDRTRTKGKELFRGKYCTINFTPPIPAKASFYKLDEVLPELKNFSQGETVASEAAKFAHFFHFLTLRLGICVPSGCSLEDINQVTKHVGKLIGMPTEASRCEVKEPNDFSTVVIAVICIYSFAGLLMFIGSLIDMYAYYTKTAFIGKGVRILLCFSLITNFQKFTNTKTSSDTLSCLNGVRFLCMSWVVLGHTYLNVNFQIFLGLEKVRDYAKDFAFQAITNASVAVDTFFFIGGLLVCYVTIKAVRHEGHKFNVKLYIIHRLWRILPVYIYVILFMFLGNLLGSGPIWYDTTHKYIQACYDNWWTNIIFINNFYHAEHMCIPQSWYIASDFQLYIAALFILIPLLRWPKIGISLSVITIIVCIIYSTLETYINNYPPTMLFAHPDPEQRIAYWAYFYFRPYVHAGPYCIGLLSGYLLATKPDLKIPKVMQVLGWSLAFTCCFSVLYGVIEWNRGVEPSLWGGLLYAGLNRTAWTLGVSWMIICCATGHGGVINYILSWKAFIPLGRLTFIVYLIHPIVQIAVVGNVRTQIQPDHFMAVWIFFGHLCATYAAAFAGTMLVEAPTMALEKILFKTGRKKDEIIRNGHSNGKAGKNGDVGTISAKDSEVNHESDNQDVVYKL